MKDKLLNLENGKAVCVIDELNYKLEEALEDNVTIQTEFEIYKQIMGEKLSRKRYE